MSYYASSVSCTPSCGAPQPPPQAAPSLLPMDALYAGQQPGNPMNAVQGQVLQQDVLPPSSEVYGQGSMYSRPQGAPSKSAPCEVSSGCFSPREQDDASTQCRPLSHYPPTQQQHQQPQQATAVTFQATPSAASFTRQTAAPQVVTYGQASTANPASYMCDNYVGGPAGRTSGAFPVVGMVQQPGMHMGGGGPPPVAYGQMPPPGNVPMMMMNGPTNYGYGYGANSGAAFAPQFSGSYGAPPPPPSAPNGYGCPPPS